MKEVEELLSYLNYRAVLDDDFGPLTSQPNKKIVKRRRLQRAPHQNVAGRKKNVSPARMGDISNMVVSAIVSDPPPPTSSNQSIVSEDYSHVEQNPKDLLEDAIEQLESMLSTKKLGIRQARLLHDKLKTLYDLM